MYNIKSKKTFSSDSKFLQKNDFDILFLIFVIRQNKILKNHKAFSVL